MNNIKKYSVRWNALSPEQREQEFREYALAVLDGNQRTCPACGCGTFFHAMMCPLPYVKLGEKKGAKAMSDYSDDAHANREFEPGYPDNEEPDMAHYTENDHLLESPIDPVTRILRWLIVIGIVVNVLAQLWLWHMRNDPVIKHATSRDGIHWQVNP